MNFGGDQCKHAATGSSLSQELVWEAYGGSVQTFTFEFPENRIFLTANPLQPVGDILVLAGDIITFQGLNKARDLFDFACDHYSAVYWVPGNHEYYGTDITDKPDPCFSYLHEESISFLSKTLDEGKEGPVLVVTHHVPTLMNYPQMYKNSPLNEAFAVELFGLIAETEVDYWIYGHHHVNIPDFNIGKTRMLTNQLGYVHQYEHGLFRRDAVIEVLTPGSKVNLL